MFATALPLIAVSTTRDPLALSMVTVGLTVPWLAFALLSGALVDRWDRLTTMKRVDLARFVVTAALALTVANGSTSIPLIVAAALVLGTAETVFDTASLAVVPSLVGTDTERLTKANARLEGASIVANGFAGPPLGASLFTLAPALPVAVNAISFLASTMLLRRVRAPKRSPIGQPDSRLRTEIADGMRWLRRQPLLLTFAMIVGVINLAVAGAGSLLVLLIADHGTSTTIAFPAVLTAGAVGALAGNVLAERHAASLIPTRVLPAAVAAMAAALIAIAAFPQPAAIGADFIIVGLAGGLWNVITVALRQQRIPDQLLGRINSVYRLIAYGTIPIGALLAGTLASATGPRPPFLIGGIAIALTIPRLTRSLRRDMPSQIRQRQGCDQRHD